jgi:glucuronokinase
MDFEEGLMKAERRGRYTPLDPSLLPPLWLMHCREASDSGRVHSDVKRRWLEGDPAVREAMGKVAEVAVEGRWVVHGWLRKVGCGERGVGRGGG